MQTQGSLSEREENKAKNKQAKNWVFYGAGIKCNWLLNLWSSYTFTIEVENLSRSKKEEDFIYLFHSLLVKNLFSGVEISGSASCYSPPPICTSRFYLCECQEALPWFYASVSSRKPQGRRRNPQSHVMLACNLSEAKQNWSPQQCGRQDKCQNNGDRVRTAGLKCVWYNLPFHSSVLTEWSHCKSRKKPW